MNDRVSLHIENGIAQVQLNRPDKLNALDKAMFEGLLHVGQQLESEKAVRVVIISGAGRGFCAGLDMASFTGSPVGSTDLEQRTYGTSNLFQQVVMQWRKLKPPVIAAIHGVCIGGGLQIVSGADIRISTADARMSIMEMRWGIIPDMGGFTIWRNLLREDVLRELTYTNREISGTEAQSFGLVTYLAEDPLQRAMDIASEICRKNPAAVQSAKSIINRLADMDEAEILLAESRDQKAILGTENQAEAVMAFMQKREPRFVD